VRGRLRGVSIIPDMKRKFAIDEKILLAGGLVMVAILYLSDALYMLK